MFKRLGALQRKLLRIVLLTTLVAVLVALSAMVLYDLRMYHQGWVADMITQAELLGQTSAPALAFDDAQVATENLALLRSRPKIHAAAIYTPKGALFATYVSPDAIIQFPKLPEEDGVHIEGRDLSVVQRIVDEDEILGTVYLRAEYELFDRVLDYLGIAGVVTGAAMLVALLMSAWLQRVITRPILAIARIAREVVEQRDYSRRAEKLSQDEVGVLVASFNDMLMEIERRTRELEASNRELAREVAERTRADLALRRSEERHRMLVSALTSVIWSADRDGSFGEDEHSWESYTGQDAATYRGAGWREGIHPDDRSTVEHELAAAANGPQPAEIVIRLWHAASGDHRWVIVRAVPVMRDGALQEWIGTVTDIHDRWRAEQEIQRLNAELEDRVRDRTAQLEAANRELQAFSYSVSHDLRAPLRAIDGFSHLLMEEFPQDLSANARRCLSIIQTSTRRMAQLIDDLLTLARVSRDALVRRAVDVSALAREVVNDIRERDPARTVEVSVCEGMLSDADPRLLRVALENLIGNAWKFTGKVERAQIEIGVMRDNGRTVFFVRDNGAGFDMALADKLFNAFQRLHSDHEYVGTGIGLATVQRIIHRHGGRVWADASVGKGAVFFFTLALDGDEHSQAAPLAGVTPDR